MAIETRTAELSHAQGCSDLASCIHSARLQWKGDDNYCGGRSFAQQVASMYKMQKQGMYEATAESLDEIVRRFHAEVPEGTYLKPLHELRGNGSLPQPLDSLPIQKGI